MSGILPYQIKTSKDNLLFVGRMSIKSVIDRSCFETLHDRAPEVINFCNILEHLLSFCTKGFTQSFYTVDNRRHPWLFIKETCKNLPDSCVTTIDTMENLKGHYAKLRGWIKLALLQKRLAEYLQHASRQQTALTRFYDPRSLMRSQELNVYVNTLMGLTAVDFSFDLRGEDQVHPGLMCIDFTPYLRFTPSDESLLDDALECDEHLDLNSSCPWQERFLKLEVKYKREAQQKHFLEERLRALDTLMMNREVEREQFETEMKQLESVILELQVQITLLQEQYREELLRLGGNPDTIPNVPAARGFTRPLPPSMLTHRLAAVEPTARARPGLQEFAKGRRYSSPQTSSRENLARVERDYPNDEIREDAYEALEDAWADDDYERVILFPDDEQETSPEPESRQVSEVTNSLTDAPSVSPAVTPDVVRRVREGGSDGASGYYRLMATPRDTDSVAASLLENSRRDFTRWKLIGMQHSNSDSGKSSANDRGPMQRLNDDSTDVKEPHEDSNDVRELHDDSTDVREPHNESDDVREPDNDSVDVREPHNESSDLRESHDESSDIRDPHDDYSDVRDPRDDTTGLEEPQVDPSDDEPQDDPSDVVEPHDDVRRPADDSRDIKASRDGSNNISNSPKQTSPIQSASEHQRLHLKDRNDNREVLEVTNDSLQLSHDVGRELGDSNANQEISERHHELLPDANDNCEVTVVTSSCVQENGDSLDHSSGL